jgi:hypothetical protein
LHNRRVLSTIAVKKTNCVAGAGAANRGKMVSFRPPQVNRAELERRIDQEDRRMATSPPVSRSPVRQQLDELDALLQRMLSLPHNSAEPQPPEPRAAPPITRAVEYPPRAPQTPTLQDGWKQPAMMLLADSGPVAPPATPEPPRWDPSWGINLNPQNGSSVFTAPTPIPMRAAPVEAPPPVIRSEPVAYTMREPPAEPLRAITPVPAAIPEPAYRPAHAVRREPPSLLAAPFAAIDSLFDTLVGIFPLGSLLTTRIGKNAVGVAGILMLVGGLTWAALDFFGWPR